MANSSRSPKSGANPDYAAIKKQWDAAKRAKEAEDARAAFASATAPTDNNASVDRSQTQALEQKRDKIDDRRQKKFEGRWWWTVAFWGWMLVVHAVSIWLFGSGFLLTRLVLEEHSNCTAPPIDSTLAPLNIDQGCWHPKTFDRAVVILIDALRYDFTVPQSPEQAEQFHNAFPIMHDLAAKNPENAFLLPFIADPPTATLQRLKGLTTGTLPTFLDAGSNFAGTAIDEDNLLLQLRSAGKKIAQVGDDTWWALFPDYFEPNISKAYDSFNVWDLHTVDNGVIDGLFPLLEPQAKGQWDLLIGHCLGVDHAGHRYGPNHPAMTAKLQQMDDFVKRLVESIDDDTLLVVMGDHGMDGKGDHGGESDDEVEAALWMYSKRPAFGRSHPDFVKPPATAKIRPVNQIDLVPTLALMLGIPIPYNNLGRPIEEAFVGTKGNNWRNLAAVSRMAAAGIERYQASYFKARGISQTSEAESPADYWARALAVKDQYNRDAYQAYVKFQEETLATCKALWARFDVPRMISGVIVGALGVLLLLLYSSRDKSEEYVVLNDVEKDYEQKRAELMVMTGDAPVGPKGEENEAYHKSLLKGLWNPRFLFIIACVSAASIYRGQPIGGLVTVVMTLTVSTVMASLLQAGKTLTNLLPNNIWGWLSVFFTLSQSIGFASNSYTIWEDSMLLFFITTFGIVAAIASFRIESKVDRTMAVYHSVAFVVLARLASFSKLCREEQMPYCTSTYYASANSSTSAVWQLLIPFVVAIALPSVIKSFLLPTRSWQGLAPAWISWCLRAGLVIAAIYWVIDAADNGDWLTGTLAEGRLKSIGVYVAQLVLALAFVAGSTAFIWAPPNVSIVSSPSSTGQPQIAILGYTNVLGSRYLLLPLNILLGCLILSKPMGFGALAIMMWQVLSLIEIIDYNKLKTETIGPIMLAVLGNFYFFKTGHQASPASLQWDSAFIPLFSIRYPWTPIVVLLNTCGGQIIAAACVPLIATWKVGPKQKGVLRLVARGLGVFIAYYAVESLATMAWAGHLRRHLMVYRIFTPRFMMAALVLVVLDIIVIAVSLVGFRSNTLAISEVFGWAE
ncbi:type I phosphodiesterase / nucleotide pyrophosphatase domain-containing protein [Sarocladium implicatum]|nr:type I phosphodiesterase / nucleotide pyrophosphatase domain-containing protein [Sarocladium implicatum]